jgi:hypothetical protein
MLGALQDGRFLPNPDADFVTVRPFRSGYAMAFMTSLDIDVTFRFCSGDGT